MEKETISDIKPEVHMLGASGAISWSAVDAVWKDCQRKELYTA